MTQPQPHAPHSAPTPASGRGMTVVAIVTLLAPIVAVLAKLPSAGWLFVFFIFAAPVWLLGYALLVVAVARGMLRRRGVLRVGARRTRAIAWALLTSLGAVVLGLTIVDGGDSPHSIQSTLTLMLGAPESPSAAHSVSETIGLVAAVAWIGGYVALVAEWVVGGTAARAAQTSAAPRVEPPRID